MNKVIIEVPKFMDITISDKEWSLTDCISIVVMQNQGLIDALTHDKHFVQAGFRSILWKA